MLKDIQSWLHKSISSRQNAIGAVYSPGTLHMYCSKCASDLLFWKKEINTGLEMQCEKNRDTLSACHT